MYKHLIMRHQLWPQIMAIDHTETALFFPYVLFRDGPHPVAS